jgi:hypothetical protein
MYNAIINDKIWHITQTYSEHGYSYKKLVILQMYTFIVSNMVQNSIAYTIENEKPGDS